MNPSNDAPDRTSDEDDSAWFRQMHALDRFDERWQTAGNASIVEFLPAEPRGERRDLLIELIKVDLEYRWGHGQQIFVEDYVRQFPELGEPATLPIELIVEELRARRGQGRTVSDDELDNRFPGRVAELHAALGRGGPESLSVDSVSISRADTISPARQWGIGASGPRPALESVAGVRNGTATLGRYELREQVGQGGFATVWRAFDPQLRREVAIKVPRSESIEAPGFRERIEREVQAAARLRHPAIVPIFEVGHAVELGADGQGTGAPFIVYEFITGPTLAKLLQQTNPSPLQAAEWIATLADALSYAHRSGIVHRDIKPANVMMETDAGAQATDGTLEASAAAAGPLDLRSSSATFRPKLTDFGLARQGDATATLTQQGDILGTPAYMSPEQARGDGHSVDARTDVYSLGVMLYEMLVGRRPFEGSGASVLNRVIHHEPESPRQIRPSVPLDLETICLKAMAKEVSRRYQSAGELLDDLRRFIEHRPIRARRIGLAGRFVRWCRRQPAVAASIGIATTLSLAVVAGSFVRIVAERDRASEQAASFALDRAVALCESGDPATGMLWMARSLELAPKRAEHLRYAIRVNLAAWQSRVPRHQLLIEGHDAPQSAMCSAISGDGRVMALGRMDGSVQLWDLQAGHRICEMDHPAPVTCVAFSQSGGWMFTSDRDGTARLWRIQLAEPLVPPTHKEAPGDSAASDRAQLVRAWSHGREPGDTLLVMTGNISADGQFAVTVGPTIQGDTSARVWDLTTGSLVCESSRHPLRVWDVRFSPDGREFATACEDGLVRRWDSRTGESVAHPFKHSAAAVQVAFGPRGDVIATAASDNTARLWDTTTGQPMFPPFELHKCTGVTFSPDGGTVAMASIDRNVRFWNVRNGRPTHAPLRHPDPPLTSIAFTADGTSLLTVRQDSSVHRWELPSSQSPRLELKHERQVLAATFSRDGKSILTGGGVYTGSDGFARWWNRQDGQPLGEPIRHVACVTAVATSPDGTSFLTGMYAVPAGANAIQHWDRATLEPVESLHVVQEGITTLVINPRGGTFVSGSFGAKDALVHDMATGEPSGPPLRHGAVVRSAVFSADGKLVATAGSNERTVRIWDFATRQPLGKSMLHTGQVGAVAISPDGRFVLAGTDAKVAQLWEVATQHKIGPPLEHAGTVRSVSFSPDGRLIATGSWDKSARFWEPMTGKPLGPPMRHDGEVEVCAFSPDGRELLTAGWDKTARLWPVPVPIEGSTRDIVAWTQAITGLALESNNAVRILTPSERARLPANVLQASRLQTTN